MGRFVRRISALLLIWLWGCGISPEPNQPLATSYPSTTPTAQAMDTPQPAPATPTLQQEEGWATTTWQNLIIPLPPSADLQFPSPQSPSGATQEIIDQAALIYTPTGQQVEQPYGPVFTLYSFSGSLDQWIELQHQHNSLAVDTGSVGDITLAAQAAKRYQPAIVGTCNSGYYLLKISPNQLLEIFTQCIDTEPYMTIMSQLVLVDS